MTTCHDPLHESHHAEIDRLDHLSSLIRDLSDDPNPDAANKLHRLDIHTDSDLDHQLEMIDHRKLQLCPKYANELDPTIADRTDDIDELLLSLPIDFTIDQYLDADPT